MHFDLSSEFFLNVVLSLTCVSVSIRFYYVELFGAILLFLDPEINPKETCIESF